MSLWANVRQRYGSTLLWRFGRPALRIARLGAASASLYTIGYSEGMKQVLTEPHDTLRQLVERTLASQAHGASTLDAAQPDARLVSRIGHELLEAARAYLVELEETASTAEERGEAAKKLKRLQSLAWHFVVIDDGTVNAFVNDMLPGYVFVHRGLLRALNHREDELSFIIGHELSHYLHDHGSEARKLGGLFSALSLVLLATADPTGILSAALELPVAASLFSLVVVLPMSREAEREADALGLELLARTCRSPDGALRAHERLAAFEEAHGGDPSVTSIVSSHPATMERLLDMRRQLPAAHATYSASGCAAKKRALWFAYRAAS